EPEQIKLTYASTSQLIADPDEVYKPENPFIRKVEIYRKKDFLYYSAFYEAGMNLLGLIGEKCDEPSFYSWVPQYSQLSEDQMSFYLYMRSEIRENRAIDIRSYSYILLYIFELINVEPNKKNALSQLSFVWKSYRNAHPRLDALLREWIIDFCLINRLLPNTAELGEAYGHAVEFSSVRELYICSDKSRDEIFLSKELPLALLQLCSNYDYKKSKFATGDNLQLYDEHIIGSFSYILSEIKNEKGLFIGITSVKRDAFAGAICTKNTKCSIKIDYCSIARSHEMRFLITDAKKYAENCIRSYIGVKSKLTIYSLPSDVRDLINKYMEDHLPGKRAPKKEEKHDYDIYYEAPKRVFSLESAKQIEEASWETTKILTDAFDCEENSAKSAEIPVAPAVNLPIDSDIISALSLHMEFIEAALAHDKATQAHIAQKKGRMIDAVADEINEIAAEILGDIILENENGAYTVIEDYVEVFKNAGK
ncbi:MAG: TerB N-terminal domain-containing protein, partial [Clostridia bacterium]|nr:TerB N-terminal domain-containing protein [Clostridia bacterium]